MTSQGRLNRSRYFVLRPALAGDNDWGLVCSHACLHTSDALIPWCNCRSGIALAVQPLRLALSL